MLFGHQNHDVSQPVPEPAPAAPALNPLAVDPTTGASLPVITEDSAHDTPAPAPVVAAPDNTFAGVSLPPPPAPLPATLPTTAPLTDTPTVDAAMGGEGAIIAPTPEELLTEPEPTLEPAAEIPAEPPLPPTDLPPVPEPDPVPAVEPEPVMPLDEPMPEPIAESVASESVDAPQPSSAMELADMPNMDDLLVLKQHALEQLSPLVDQLDQTPEEKFRTKMMMIQSTDDQSLIREAYEIAQTITDEKVRAQALLDVINEINYFTSQQG